MRRANAIRLAALALLVAPACSSDNDDDDNPGLIDSGATDADTSSTTPDAGQMAADAGQSIDIGFPDMGLTVADSGTMTMLGPVCQELNMCCSELSGAGQMTCQSTAAAAVEADCQQGLDLARNVGQCLPEGFDSGPPVDAGPAGPVCSLLELCCAELQILQQQCFDVAAGRDETRCQNTLDIAQRVGNCQNLSLDGGMMMMDAGTATTADAGMMMDAGMLMDTGTATTGDAGL